jgi:hypothetical protein
MEILEKFLKNVKKMGNVVELAAIFGNGGIVINDLENLKVDTIVEKFPKSYPIVVKRLVNGKEMYYAGYVNNSKIIGISGYDMKLKMIGKNLDWEYYDFPKYFFTDGMKKLKRKL